MSRGRRRGGGRRLVVMVMPMMVMPVMVMPVVMMPVMMMLRRSSRRRGSGLLRDGVTGKAERKHGGGGKGLDHGMIFLR